MITYGGTGDQHGGDRTVKLVCNGDRVVWFGSRDAGGQCHAVADMDCEEGCKNTEPNDAGCTDPTGVCPTATANATNSPIAATPYWSSTAAYDGVFKS